MGLSFGEMLVLAVVALVVVGPKDLPRILRTVGQFLGQARRAVADVRRETGLDEVLRGDFRDLERLADHIERLEPYRGDAALVAPPRETIDLAALRLREYPSGGADAGELLAEDAEIYRNLPPARPNALPEASAPLSVAPTDATAQSHASSRPPSVPTPGEVSA